MLARGVFWCRHCILNLGQRMEINEHSQPAWPMWPCVTTLSPSLFVFFLGSRGLSSATSSLPGSCVPQGICTCAFSILSIYPPDNQVAPSISSFILGFITECAEKKQEKWGKWECSFPRNHHLTVGFYHLTDEKMQV